MSWLMSIDPRGGFQAASERANMTPVERFPVYRAARMVKGNEHAKSTCIKYLV